MSKSNFEKMFELKEQLDKEFDKPKRRLIFKDNRKELYKIAKGEGMFEIKIFNTLKEVRNFIKKDEGKCIQQICYSSYHDALTQINFTDKIIRTNINLNDTKQKK